ncbi:hypothetical protein [Photobacterium sanguinicancri]|uniref:hypothetical protein n=1 Tax=Photobacterium sanguinicancri TaxID=875932 RepID=UPI0026E2DCD2|nr:hypothetical protein [Photobacterium sanguinicancri]MDO6497923.1 hypothetical protein [Photobacterium sanguinicancri]
MRDTFKLASVLCLTSLVFGCAETPKEFMSLKSKDADDYALDSEDYSKPTRFLYPQKWAKPSGKNNNLDGYLYDVDPNKNVDRLQMLTLASGVKYANPFGMAMNLLMQETYRGSIDATLGEQTLYTVTKFDKKKDWDEQANAVMNMANKTVMAVHGNKAVLSNNGVEHLLLNATEIRNPDNVFCQKNEYFLCNALNVRIPMVLLDNDNYIPMVPQGDYITAQTYLPIGFPIEKLTSINVEGVTQFLYVPPIKENKTTSFWKEENLKYVSEWYKQDRISINPYLKNLNTKEVMYFNPKISAKQKDKYSLYKVFPSSATDEAISKKSVQIK